MVVPFQILVAVGVIHALLGILREFLLGSGSVAILRAPGGGLGSGDRRNPSGPRTSGRHPWSGARDTCCSAGPLVAVYAVWGARRLGSTAGALWSAVREPVGLLACEAGALAFIVDRRPAGRRWE